MTVFVIACSSEDGNPEQIATTEGNDLLLRISASATARTGTRAWQDPNALDEEMMNVWVVVVTNTSDGSVRSCFACRPAAGGEREIDEVAHLSKGNYTVYSFANISVASVCSLLGLTAPATIPTISNTPQIISVTGTVSDAAAKLATIHGNNFNPNASDNGYGEMGIPMSNVQTITETDTEKDLIVIRMLAKIEIQVFNDGAHDVTINSISLTDVTANATGNLKLLPMLTSGSVGADDMEAVHKDIQPNLGDGAGKSNVVYTPPTTDNLVAAKDHKSTDATPSPVKFTFYVNESTAPENASGLFYLSLGVETGSGDEVVYTHALISQDGKTSDDNNAWAYIARNDYRIIPVVLTDWQFRIEPIAFVPIAGYPAVTLSSDALSATFSTGGMIALQPFVKKRTEDSWRDFDDSEVELVSIHWTNSDGTDVAGDDKIVKTAFVYDDVTKFIIGELNQDKVTAAHTNKTAITVTVKVGPSESQYTYSFTCDVNL